MTSTIIKPDIKNMTVADLKNFCLQHEIPIKGLRLRRQFEAAVEQNTIEHCRLTHKEADLLLQNTKTELVGQSCRISANSEWGEYHARWKDTGKIVDVVAPAVVQVCWRSDGKTMLCDLKELDRSVSSNLSKTEELGAIAQSDEQPKERPIIFSPPMVRAIMSRTKTVTRRIMKTQPMPFGSDLWILKTKILKTKDDSAIVWSVDEKPPMHLLTELSPYGIPGDNLWVRETWYVQEGANLPLYRADYYATMHRFGQLSLKWKSPIFMPRRFSRLTLQIVSLRAERLQQMTEEDARKEGVQSIKEYALLWDVLHSESNWQSNPWVWVVDFRVLSAPLSRQLISQPLIRVENCLCGEGVQTLMRQSDFWCSTTDDNLVDCFCTNPMKNSIGESFLLKPGIADAIAAAATQNPKGIADAMDFKTWETQFLNNLKALTSEINSQSEEQELCPNCDGEGSIVDLYAIDLHENRQIPSRDLVCEVCNGTGKVTEFQYDEYWLSFDSDEDSSDTDCEPENALIFSGEDGDFEKIPSQLDSPDWPDL